MTFQLDKSSLLSSLNNITNNKANVIIIGDLILDEYIIGSPERISREAPVLILEYCNNYYKLGGAANAAVNASALGMNVHLIGLLGNDNYADIFEGICRDNNIQLHSIKLDDCITTSKTRILASNISKSLEGAGTDLRQQVLRIDKLLPSSSKFTEYTEYISTQVIEKLKEIQAEYILLSDYTLGCITPQTIHNIYEFCNASSKNYQFIVDPSRNFDQFGSCQLITPNQPDTEYEINYKLNSDLSNLNIFIEKFTNYYKQPENILITRGANGMMYINNITGQVTHIPVFNQAEVYDVTGAGDTVSGTILSSLASGNNMLDSIILGNLAASITVRKQGSATTTIAELIKTLDNLNITK